MAIEFPCECGQPLQAQDEHAGRLTRCPKCGREVTIPAIRAAPAAAPPPRPQAVSPRPRRDVGHLEDDDDDRERRRRRRPQSSGTGSGGTVLVVLGIVGAVLLLCLVGGGLLLFPAVQKVRQAAARAESHNNLKQMALAMLNYNDQYGQLPPAVVYDRDGKPLYSWRVLLLPYLEQNNLYNQFHLDEPWDSPNNKPLLAMMPKVYLQPGAAPREPYATYYQVFDGPGAAFDSDKRNGLIPFGQPGLGLQQGKNRSRIPATFQDGTANTILIVEAGDPVPWTQPADLRWDPNGPLPKLGGMFNGDFNAALADSSTRFLSPKITSERTLRAAVTASGGEILGSDW
jgi:hypothetical protein